MPVQTAGPGNARRRAAGLDTAGRGYPGKPVVRRLFRFPRTGRRTTVRSPHDARAGRRKPVSGTAHGRAGVHTPAPPWSGHRKPRLRTPSARLRLGGAGQGTTDQGSPGRMSRACAPATRRRTGRPSATAVAGKDGVYVRDGGPGPGRRPGRGPSRHDAPVQDTAGQACAGRGNPRARGGPLSTVPPRVLHFPRPPSRCGLPSTAPRVFARPGAVDAVDPRRGHELPCRQAGKRRVAASPCCAGLGQAWRGTACRRPVFGTARLCESRRGGDGPGGSSPLASPSLCFPRGDPFRLPHHATVDATVVCGTGFRRRLRPASRLRRRISRQIMAFPTSREDRRAVQLAFSGPRFATE